jgi:hypothetical protein
MISLNTWNTLYEGKYGNQELNILYKDDIFVSFLRLRDKTNVLIQVYKVFVVKGDLETFANTLPFPAIVYQKHIDIGSKNNFKYLLLHTETEYVDINTLSYHVDKKITELNKMVGSVISVVKSYNIKLISLKLAEKRDNDYFFSDPEVIKSLSNMPLSLDFKSSTPLDKLILGKKKDITVTTSLSNLKSVSVYGPNLDDRLFISKIICENYLLSSKTVIVFDSVNNFISLGYPQQNSEVLDKFELNMDPFGFPVKKINYSDIKMPLGKIPFDAFVNIFSFKDVSLKIINEVFSKELVTIKDLISKVQAIKITNEINDFEKLRVLSKLKVLDKKYGSFFNKTNVSVLFKQRYQNIGSVKLININPKDPIAPYFIKGIVEDISLNLKDDILVVFPELNFVFNNIYLGSSIQQIIKDNSTLNFLTTSKSEVDFRDGNFSSVKIISIKDNDAVLYYPNRDAIRLLFRPTFTSSVINYKFKEDI